MKLTKSQLRQVIKEEITKQSLNENTSIAARGVLKNLRKLVDDIKNRKADPKAYEKYSEATILGTLLGGIIIFSDVDKLEGGYKDFMKELNRLLK